MAPHCSFASPGPYRIRELEADTSDCNKGDDEQQLLDRVTHEHYLILLNRSYSGPQSRQLPLRLAQREDRTAMCSIVRLRGERVGGVGGTVGGDEHDDIGLCDVVGVYLDDSTVGSPFRKRQGCCRCD